MVMLKFLSICSVFCWILLPVINFVAANPIEGDVRLVDGGAPNQGRVEIYSNNTWWKLCSHYFHGDAHETVCRQLGLEHATQHYRHGEFGAGNMSFLATSFYCEGHHSSLEDCNQNQEDVQHCGDENVIGVVCGEMVFAECFNEETGISGQLRFARGSRPNEIQCKWKIHNPNEDQVIINIPRYRGDHCGTPEIRVWNSMSKQVFERHYCQHMENPILLEISSTFVTLLVTIWENYSNAPPFVGSYVIVKGSFESAPQVSGWIANIQNVTVKSIHVQWPQLTSEINRPVEAYVMQLSWNTEYEHNKVTGRILPSNVTSVNIDGLHGFVDYTVMIIAVDDLGQPHKSSTTVVKTLEGAPTHPPTDVQYDSITSDSVHFRWSTIPDDSHNGLLLGYTIQYYSNCRNHEGRINVSLSVTSYTITSLLPGTKYEIRIAGYTSAGIGDEEHREIFTSCVGQETLTDNNGTIRSPGYTCGEYVGFQYCNWTLRPSGPSSAILITFNDFSLSYDHGDSYCRLNDYVGISSEVNKNDSFLCDHFYGMSVLVSSSQADVTFSAREDRRSRGFTASYEILQNSFTAANPLSSWNMSIRNVESYSAEVEWTEFPLSEVDIGDHLMVKITETNKDISWLLKVGRYDRDRHIERLIPNREYVIQVLAFNGSITDGPSYSSQTITITTLPGAPSIAPIVRLENLPSYFVKVEWDQIPQGRRHGELKGYNIYFNKRHHYGDKKQVNTTSSVTHVIVTDLEPMMEYEFAVAAFTSEEGPLSEEQSITVGCGGRFNQSYGMINLSKTDWESRQCSWKIYNVGLHNAVLLMSIKEIRFHHCGFEYAKILKDGHDVENHQDCSRLRNDLVTVEFGASEFLTAEVQVQNMESRVRTQFVVVKGGLDSALDPQNAWVITSHSSGNSIALDWSAFPNELVPTFFIISLNQTQIIQDDGNHHHDDEYKNPIRFLDIVNASKTEVNVSGLPAAMEFQAVVFLVNNNNDIYKSQRLTIMSEEGVPSQAPYLHDWRMNFDERSVFFRLIPIEPRYHEGKLRGYRIKYHPFRSPDDTSVVEVNENTTEVTLNNLNQGTIYVITIAGFTSRGEGKTRTVSIALCGGEIHSQMGNFSSPGYPNTPYIPEDQHDDSMRCHWRLRPQDPSVRFIKITLVNFFLGRKDYRGRCSGQLRVHFPDREWENGKSFDVCGKETNYSLLIESKEVDVQARGFSYHRHDDEFRDNNGTKFLVRFKALSQESATGQVLVGWTGTIRNVTNMSAILSWPVPPSNFLGGATVDRYLLLGGKVPTQIFHMIWLHSERNHLIDNLDALTNYTGKIIAILSDGRRGSTDWIGFKTKEGIPSTNPHIHEREVIDFSSIWIRWDKLEERETGGTLLGFRVRIKEETYNAPNPFYKEITVGPDQFDLNITGLPPETSFRVWVTAFTAVGEGIQKHEVWIRTKCGWPLNSTTGVIRSRGYPDRMEHSECVWYIYPKNNYSVFLWFEHVDIPESHECERNYVAVGDDSGVRPRRMCGNFDKMAVLVEAHRVPILFRGDHMEGFLKGFEMYYIVLNESTTEATLVANWNILNISNIAIGSISAVWPHYSPNHPYELVAYAVVCTPTSSKFGPTILTVEKSMDRSEVDRLRPGTNYTVEIVALNYNNQTGQYSLVRSQSESLESKEGVPRMAPDIHRIDTFINISTFIYVTWSPIPHDMVDGYLLGYKVYYRIGDQGEFSSKAVGPNVFQANITIVSDPTNYEIRVAGFTRAGDGPMSNPRERSGCQANIVSRMGYLTSPRFPQPLPGRLQCLWAFQPDYAARRFRLVVAFDTVYLRDSEGAPNCTNYLNDFMGLARINPIRFIAGPFCARFSPFAIVSWEHTSDTPYMGFFTGLGPADRGFNSTYFTVFDVSKISISVVSESITGFEVQVTWSTSGIGEQIQQYVVLYTPVREENQEIKNGWSFQRTTQSQATLVPLQPLTEYSVFVLGYTASHKVYGSNDIVFTTTGDVPSTASPLPPTTPPVIRMYPYGNQAGDTPIIFDGRCKRISIPRGGMRFFEKRHRKFYICLNGVIQFEKDRMNQRPYSFGQRYWLRFSPMLAVYWTRTDIRRSFSSGLSKVFYQVYSGPSANTTLRQATFDVLSVFNSSLPQGTTFRATWVCVVTWVNLRHADLNPVTENLMNTFQVVIITDNIFSFVIYNYPHNGIQYSAPTSVSNYEYFTNYVGLPIVGWNAGDNGNHFFNFPRSGTVQAETIDNLPGNQRNIPGRWIMRIENSNGEEDSDFKCERWYDEQPDPNSYPTSPAPCPCTLFQAAVDNRYQWIEPIFPYTSCFYTIMRSSDKRGRRCCYYKDRDRSGALIIGAPKGGTIERYHRLVPELKGNHTSSDILGFQYCCIQAINRQAKCVKYFERRPSEGCEAYVPPVQAPVFGDPHVVTLDGKNYTFNGLGEYTMIDVNDGFFQLQARTQLAKGGGTATVFAAAVAREENTSTVQVALKSGGGLEVLIDGQTYQGFDSLTNASVIVSGSVAVSRPESNSFLMTFPSGISVTVTEIQDSLSIVFAAPTSYKGNTKGLLGTWNDDALDDFLRPDGTTLPSNATGRQIHFNFGLHWQLMANTTLFTYGPGENTSTFSNASFVPIFLDEPINFANDQLRQAAVLACQGDVNCLFDIASTGDVSVGESTKQVAIQIESEAQALENFPPTILVGPTELNVTVNTMATITVTAEDPNNDSLTFSVSGTLPSGYTTTNNASSMTITWSVTTDEIEVDIIVSDGTATAVLSPVINVCACLNQGICFKEEDNEANSANNTERFSILSCVCQNGYTGSFCDADLDACEDNFQPCYPGVNCIDSPPPANESGFECGPCPNGYSGNGFECSDIDECSVSNGGCAHNCLNTPGSSVCKCNSGYYLDADKKTCKDINECSSANDCMHQCENTEGGYNCKCNADFKVDPADSKNCVPENPCQQNQNGCQQICYQSDGQDKCSCNAGYALNDDGKTCSDVDECAADTDQCSQGCTNKDGGYDCSCVDGFRLDDNGYTCNDIDECMEFTFQCQDASQICENIHGSYKCVCGEGLYWIDNKCQGLEKGEAPPPPPTAAPPRTPSDEERAESVNMDLNGFNVSAWNEPMREAFSRSVAEAATTYYLTISNSARRKRRSANSLVFTENQVHVLPGYPKQISLIPLLGKIAFYLQAPAGSSSAVISKAVVVSIVQNSVASISSAINANISSVQTLFADTTTTSSAPTTTTTRAPLPTEKESKMMYIIAGSVAGGVLLIIIIIIVVWWCKRNKRAGTPKVNSELSLHGKVKNAEDMEMNVPYSSSNKAFENDAYMLSLKERVESNMPGSPQEN